MTNGETARWRWPHRAEAFHRADENDREGNRPSMNGSTQRPSGEYRVHVKAWSGLEIDLLERIAASDEHVVISGPPHLEKEEVARFLHSKSPRQAFPFIVHASGGSRDNPTALGAPENAGFIERAWAAANGGTLFLAELFELTDRDQAKLLRAIESRDPRTHSGAGPRSVRVIAATGHDLSGAARGTTLRSSLFHRLNVMSVRVPDVGEDARMPDDSVHRLKFKEEKMRLLEEWEPEYLRELMCHAKGNVSVAARVAGITRAHMYRLLKKHGLTH